MATARPTASPTPAATRSILLGGRRAIRLLERNVFVYRHSWLVIVTGFFEPLFYLLGIGFGLGVLVGGVEGPGGQTIPYQAFVAPALLATSAMNGAVYDSTNMFFKLKYQKTYDAILATPLSVGDVALGEVVWALGRSTLYAIGFMVVMTFLGLTYSATAILAIPAAMLIGFTVASVGLVAVTFMRSWQDLDWIGITTLPLFLFSGTFFPVTAYPEPLRLVVEATPLYRGVVLVRGLTTGAIGIEQLVSVVYLAVMGIIALWTASRRLDRLLLK
jgi:lipooligosaccharide transport system permease protein